MTKGLTVLSLILVGWVGTAGAGELVFANGSRLEGDLSNETLLVSTGTGLIEVGPEEVVTLSDREIRLRDGRVLRGTLVGGQLKAKTALGEITVKIEELDVYRAGSAAADAGKTGQHASAPAAQVAAAPTAAAPTATAPAAAPAPAPATGPAPQASQPAPVTGGLPPMSAYQNIPKVRTGEHTGPAPTVQPAALTREAPIRAPGRRLEVVDATPLYRDALFGASQIGRINPGQQVTYVDAIDRRLRILNRLVFDGGHWVKVRVPDGTEGWVPADSVREVR